MASNTAKEILKEIGGASNIVDFTHCATRLRFNLHDATKIDKSKVESIKGVLGAVPQSDTSFQVIIGGGVADVYQEVKDLIESSDAGSDNSNSNQQLSNDDVKQAERNKIKGKNKFVDSFFEFLSDSFRPIIGVLLGASLIIAIVNLMISLGFISDASDNPSTLFLNAIAQSVFYFLPVLIAYNACKKLKVDPWIGAVSILALMTPQFLALMTPDMYTSVFAAGGPGLQAAKDALQTIENPLLGDGGNAYVTNVFGLPMFLTNYKGNVFVPLLMSGCLAALYRLLKKIIPQSVQLVFVPFLSMLIIVPFTAFVLGPIGVGAGSLLGTGLSWLNTNAPFIFAIAIPLLYPFLVPLGLHWPLNALMLLNINTLGYDFIQGPMGVWNFACFGATFGVLFHSLKEKDSQMSSVAGGALAAGLLGGVSEPSLYGIHLRYKKVYSRLLAGCAAGGIVIAILGFVFPASAAPGVTTKIFAFTSLLTIPVFDQMWVYAISISVAFLVSALAVIILDYRSPEQKAKQKAVKAAEKLDLINIESLLQLSEDQFSELIQTDKKSISVELGSPISGKTDLLSNCSDESFATKMLGEGIIIKPSSNGITEILSPVDGQLKDISSTKHAFSIMSKDGICVLLHIGVDTVNLKGDGFESKLKNNTNVKKGDVLAKVDFAKLTKANLDNCVILTILNTNQMKDIAPIKASSNVNSGDKIIFINK